MGPYLKFPLAEWFDVFANNDCRKYFYNDDGVMWSTVAVATILNHMYYTCGIMNVHDLSKVTVYVTREFKPDGLLCKVEYADTLISSYSIEEEDSDKHAIIADCVIDDRMLINQNAHGGTYAAATFLNVENLSYVIYERTLIRTFRRLGCIDIDHTCDMDDMAYWVGVISCCETTRDHLNHYIFSLPRRMMEHHYYSALTILTEQLRNFPCK